MIYPLVMKLRSIFISIKVLATFRVDVYLTSKKLRIIIRIRNLQFEKTQIIETKIILLYYKKMYESVFVTRVVLTRGSNN